MTGAHGDMACLPNAEVPHGSLRRRMGKSDPTQAFRIRQAALTSVDMLPGYVRRADLFQNTRAAFVRRRNSLAEALAASQRNISVPALARGQAA